MFVGALPKPAVEQIVRVVPFDEWREVFVGCSGSFRVDRAIKQRHPQLLIHSNDVTLASCAIGALAVGEPFRVDFTGRLAFMQEALEGQPFMARVAAIHVAVEMARYKGTNAFAQAHFAHYQDRFDEFLAAAQLRLAEFMDGLELATFRAGDFRDQVTRASAVGGGLVAFPPTYKRGYENLNKFVDENTDWARPSYAVWNPDALEDFIDEMQAAGIRYCVGVDHALERHQPVAVYRSLANKPIYTFADQAGSSVRVGRHISEPFRYTHVDPAKLGPASVVELITATSGQMNFLKDIYLAKGIHHISGIANFLVLLDGALAGGFIYGADKFGGNSLFLISDFALLPKSRISKLIAMLATSELVTGRLEVRLGRRVETIETAVFTDKPVSMKYRGIFELQSRKPGRLFYVSKVRRQSPQAIYADWFKRYIADARRAGEADRSQAA